MTTLTTRERDKYQTLPPLADGGTETAWADVWNAVPEEALGQMMAYETTAAIDEDPAEVARLRQSRNEARAGRRSPRHAGERSS